MTRDEAQAKIAAATMTVVDMIKSELASVPEGAEAALGDGTLLKMLMELLPVLLELLKMFM